MVIRNTACNGFAETGDWRERISENRRIGEYYFGIPSTIRRLRSVSQSWRYLQYLINDYILYGQVETFCSSGDNHL
jgi:hypothetical protein